MESCVKLCCMRNKRITVTATYNGDGGQGDELRLAGSVIGLSVTVIVDE